MSLFSLLSVSSSGMSAQRARAEVMVENLANADTTRTPEGGPYRRKDVVFMTYEQNSAFASTLEQAMQGLAAKQGAGRATRGAVAETGVAGVEVVDVVVDQREPERRYLPGHPDADAGGYVAFPRVNPAEDMVDLMSASRGYQANVSAIVAVKDMIYRSLDLIR